MSTTKEAAQIRRGLLQRGWRIEGGRRGNHYKLHPPGGEPFVVMSTTPGKGRAIDNIKAMIKRAERRRVGGVTVDLNSE